MFCFMDLVCPEYLSTQAIITAPIFLMTDYVCILCCSVYVIRFMFKPIFTLQAWLFKFQDCEHA